VRLPAFGLTAARRMHWPQCFEPTRRSEGPRQAMSQRPEGHL